MQCAPVYPPVHVHFPPLQLPWLPQSTCTGTSHVSATVHIVPDQNCLQTHFPPLQLPWLPQSTCTGTSHGLCSQQIPLKLSRQAHVPPLQLP